MRSTPPVFGNKRDLRIWNQLHAVTGNTQKGIEEILSSDEPVHSAVLTYAIWYLDRTWDKADKRAVKKADKAGAEPDRLQRDIIIDVARRSRPKDCLAAVAAAKVLLARNDVKGAYEALGIASRSGEVRNTSLMLAEVRMVEGDIIGAREVAIMAHACDPSVDKVYDILRDIDPSGEWATRQAIQAIYSDIVPNTIPSSGRLLGLYTIYDLWSKGDHVRSSELLVDSDGYRNGELDYMLVAARMSAYERDWPTAIKLYMPLLDDKAPTYLRCEVAETLLSGGKPSMARDVLSDGDMTSIRVLRDMVRACTSDGVGLREALDTLMDNEEADWDVLADTIRTLISSSRIEEAERVLETYLDEHPDNSHALALLSEVRLRQDKVKNAMSLAKKAARDRKSSPARLQMARMMLISGDLKAADKKCTKVLDSEPFNMDALSLRRDIMVREGRYKESLDVCKRILDKEPGDTDTLIAMSEVISCLGETDGSVELFKKALHADLNWDNSRAVIESLMNHGLLEEARAVCMDLEADFPTETLLLRLRGNCEYAMEMYAEAVETYGRALAIDSNDPVIWHSKGMAEEALGEYSAAEDSYNRAVILDLSEPSYWISKASIQELDGDMHGAVESLNRAIELDPMSVYALVRKATIFTASGRTREAAYFMEVALSTTPDDKELLGETVRLHLESGTAVNALPYAEHLYKLSPTPEPCGLYARCLVEDGDAHTAIEVLTRGLNDNPDDLTLLRCKFDCLMVTGDRDDARIIMDRIASIDPGYGDLDSMGRVLDDMSAEPHVETDEEILGEDMPDMEAVEKEAVVEDVPPVEEPIVAAVPAEDVPPVEEPVMSQPPVVEEASPVVVMAKEEAPQDDGRVTLVIEDTDEEPIIFESDEDAEEEVVITPVAAPAPADMSHAMRDAVAAMEAGDLETAIPLLEAIVDTEPDNVEAHSLLGHAYCSAGDIPSAVSELDTAMFQRTDDPEVYALRASLHETMGETKDAISCYRKAISYGSDDVDVHRSLAYLLNEAEEYGEALKVMSWIMDEHADSVSDVILYADLARFCGDDAAVTRSVDLFMALEPTIEETVTYARILEEAGHTDDAARLIRSDEPLEISPSLKKSAEKVMRYACSTSMSPYDVDPYENCNLTPEEAQVIIDYISNIPDYGPIVEGSRDFEEMELRSMDIIVKCGLTDLEEGDIPIDLVFTKGGCRNLDDAINMCSYMLTALSSDADSDDPMLIELAMQIPDDARLYDIVKQASVGIYSARAVKSMSTR